MKYPPKDHRSVVNFTEEVDMKRSLECQDYVLLKEVPQCNISKPFGSFETGQDCSEKLKNVIKFFIRAMSLIYRKIIYFLG